MHPTITKPLLIACALLAACTSSVGPVDTTWQATLTATDLRDRMTGSVGVLSQSDRLSANIQLKNALPGTILTWQLRTGTCAQEGDLIGGRAVYPELTADTLGAASAVTTMDARLHSDGQYQASVLDAGGAIVACGELERY